MFSLRRTAAAVTAAAFGLLGVAGCTTPASMSTDPATWSNHDLAAQLVVAGIDTSRLPTATTWAKQGLGGIFLHGTPTNAALLSTQLGALRTAGSVPVMTASDEEGGAVQRLSRVIYPLPTAAAMGATKTPAQIQAIAYAYGKRMKALHVDTDLAPDADLAIPGYYIASLGRGFSANPSVVAADVTAWNAGLKQAGVLPVIKHWPGHGQAVNSHLGAAVTPSLSVLAGRDMIPFNSAIKAGAPSVMVGHLNVPGLTGGLPATLSPAAYSYLRTRTGTGALIMTDSMTMGAVTTALHLTSPDASVRALEAGADVVLTDNPNPLQEVAAIQRALDTGSYNRNAAVASVRRMLAAKRLTGAH